ncbi:MAG: hypothetical protein WAX89_03940 [Alphaproteobacteria bacterium]
MTIPFDDLNFRASPPQADGTTYLMLGLYLILLAFFILLNSIAVDSQDKRNKVIDGVNEGFDFRENGGNIGSDSVNESAIPLYRDVISGVTGVVQSFLGVRDYTVGEQVDDGTLYLTVDSKRFFRPGEATLIPEMVLFFEGLANKMATLPAGLYAKTHITVRGDARDVADKKDVDVLSLLGQRAVLFTRALVEQGVPEKTLTTAASVGSPRIIITFQLGVDNAKAVEEAAKSIAPAEADAPPTALDSLEIEAAP